MSLVQSVEQYVLLTLLSWLQTKGRGESYTAYTYDRNAIPQLPEGHYAVVRLEIIKSEPVPADFLLKEVPL